MEILLTGVKWLGICLLAGFIMAIIDTAIFDPIRRKYRKGKGLGL